MRETDLTVLAISDGGCSGCTGGKCPKVYRSNDGRIFVQGYLPTDEMKDQINLAENEAIVEIDTSLLKNLLNNFDGK